MADISSFFLLSSWMLVIFNFLCFYLLLYTTFRYFDVSSFLFAR